MRQGQRHSKEGGHMLGSNGQVHVQATVLTGIEYESMRQSRSEQEYQRDTQQDNYKSRQTKLLQDIAKQLAANDRVAAQSERIMASIAAKRVEETEIMIRIKQMTAKIEHITNTPGSCKQMQIYALSMGEPTGLQQYLPKDDADSEIEQIDKLNQQFKQIFEMFNSQRAPAEKAHLRAQMAAISEQMKTIRNRLHP